MAWEGELPAGATAGPFPVVAPNVVTVEGGNEKRSTNRDNPQEWRPFQRSPMLFPLERTIIKSFREKLDIYMLLISNAVFFDSSEAAKAL